jgi:hypothetical protein
METVMTEGAQMPDPNHPQEIRRGGQAMRVRTPRTRTRVPTARMPSALPNAR